MSELAQAVKKGDAHQMWKLSTLLAKNKIGPKRRNYSQPLVHKPLTEQWTTCLEKPGTEGGCDAVPFDYAQNMKDMVQQSVEAADMQFPAEILQEQIQKDIEGMKSYMRVAPKRRHVPTNSAPLEVYWMLFFQTIV